MSYNIDNIDVIELNAGIRASDVLKLSKNDQLPEQHFLEEMLDDARDATPDTIIPIPKTSFWWSGEGSGRSFDDVFLEEVAPKIVGRIEAVLYYEGGDSVVGLLVKDGKAVTCDVEMVLVKPEGW